MEILTHKGIDNKICGTPLEVNDGFSRVELKTGQRMAVDDTGLVHGGFIFGLADYSAMIAVNHPNVVLGSAEVKFIKPVKIGETLIAEARINSEEGRKKSVYVKVKRNEKDVFEGNFECFILKKHVLAKRH